MSVPEGQERDALPYQRIVVVVLVGIAIGVAACAWSAWMERPIPRQLTRAAPPSALQRAVEDSLYDASRAAAPQGASRQGQLDAWSWADRGRRLVNVPISQAMELWLARHAPSGGAR